MKFRSEAKFIAPVMSFVAMNSCIPNEAAKGPGFVTVNVPEVVESTSSMHQESQPKPAKKEAVRSLREKMLCAMGRFLKDGESECLTEGMNEEQRIYIECEGEQKIREGFVEMYPYTMDLSAGGPVTFDPNSHRTEPSKVPPNMYFEVLEKGRETVQTIFADYYNRGGRREFDPEELWYTDPYGNNLSTFNYHMYRYGGEVCIAHEPSDRSGYNRTVLPEEELVYGELFKAHPLPCDKGGAGKLSVDLPHPLYRDSNLEPYGDGFGAAILVTNFQTSTACGKRLSEHHYDQERQRFTVGSGFETDEGGFRAHFYYGAPQAPERGVEVYRDGKKMDITPGDCKEIAEGTMTRCSIGL